MEKHRRLFAGLALEADIGLDHPVDAGGLQPRPERAEIVPRKDDAEMWHGNVMTIDGIAGTDLGSTGIEMRDDLMAEKVEIDPMGVRPAFRAAEQFAVKAPGRIEIVDGKGKVEWRKLAHASVYCQAAAATQ